MSLPALPDRTITPSGGWIVLANRLRAIGLTPQFVARIQEAGMGLTVGRQHALWKAEWSRESAPAAFALRMLMLADPIPESEAIGALTEPVFIAARDAGLIINDGGWFSPFGLSFMDGLFLFNDRTSREADAVMAVSPTTKLLSTASMPKESVGLALDLGCGCGALALRLSQCAKRVIATDLNSRAVDLSAFNALVNGVQNVTFLTSDMFEAVKDERFDLIVCQPPFLARMEDTPNVAFLHGGLKGDELAMRVLRESLSHLTPSGRLVMLNDWPMHIGDSSLVARLRTAVSEDQASVVVLLSDATDMSTHCASYVSSTEGDDHHALAKRIQEHLEHFGSLRIAAVRQAVCMMGRSSVGTTYELSIPGARWTNIRRSDMDSIFDAMEFQADGVARHLDKSVRITPGTTFLCRWTDAPENGQLYAEPAPDSPFPTLQVNHGAIELIRALTSAPNVGSALQALAQRESVPQNALHAPVQAALATGLLRGILILN
jgi:methylase of polypeptide subunit release factors